MARGVQFLTLVKDLRSALGRSNSVAVGVDDLPALKRALNSVYSTLYLKHDWPHLRTVFDRFTLNAGQRYYDFPTGLNVERVEDVSVWYSGKPTQIDRGIGVSEYATFSSDDDDRSEPALRWDVRWTGSSDQIEVWPIPSTSDQSMQFTGIYAITKLVNDTDLCLLDDTLVVNFAAAMLASKEDEKKMLGAAQDHYDTLVGRTKGGLRGYRMGLGSDGVKLPNRAIVRVSG